MSEAVDSSNDAGTQVLGSVLAKVILVLFMLFTFVLGAWIAGTGFHDPDTCWLLGLGRYIFTHHALPTADPFSFTFSMGSAKPFVMYQWLTELFFYACVHAGGLISLLAVAALDFYLAFFFMPMWVFDKLGILRLRTFLLITLAIASASFHTLIRPEVVSYLLLSAWLAVTILMRQADEKIAQDENATLRIDWRLVGCFSALMLIWCNMHTAFTGPLVVLTIYVLTSTVQWLLSKNRGAYPHATAACALVASLLCTLVNPSGFGLWQYIPLLFFSPINRFIVELRPFSGHLSDITYYPFIVLSILAVADCWHMLIKSSRKPRASWFSPVVLAVLIVLAFFCRRLIPFHAIALIYECAWMRSYRDTPAKTGVLQYASEKLSRLFSPNLAWLAINSVIVVVGVIAIATGKYTRPSVPQSGVAFHNPATVIEYLKQHPPSGRGFNSPEFGDVMIWQLEPVPQIFIDTRYDMYGAPLVNQCIAIGTCEPGWRKLLDGYNIGWVFIPPKFPLNEQLSDDPNWIKLVDSPEAVYFKRKSAERKP